MLLQFCKVSLAICAMSKMALRQGSGRKAIPSEKLYAPLQVSTLNSKWMVLQKEKDKADPSSQFKGLPLEFVGL